MRHIVALLLVLALVGTSTPSWAGSSSSGAEVAYGAGSAFGTLVYAPLKVTFCILGGIGSAFTAIVSPPTAGKVAMASCGGSWVITPDIVKGRETVKFVGDTSPDRTTAAR